MGTFLMDYQYKIQFRSTGNHANADALLRLPIKEKELLSTENCVIATVETDRRYTTNSQADCEQHLQEPSTIPSSPTCKNRLA